MKVYGIIALALVGAGALVTGCGSASGASGESTTCESMGSGHGSGGMAAMADMCPMKVPGTTVAAVDVEGGVALAFTTSSGDVAELRRRVTHMAQMHNRRHAAGGMMPAATAAAEDVEGGARVVLHPTDPAQLEALRSHAETHAERMATGGCSMSDRAEGPAMPAGGGHEGHDPPPAR